jgi:hypothetical protein
MPNKFVKSMRIFNKIDNAKNQSVSICVRINTPSVISEVKENIPRVGSKVLNAKGHSECTTGARLCLSRFVLCPSRPGSRLRLSGLPQFKPMFFKKEKKINMSKKFVKIMRIFIKIDNSKKQG